MQSEFSASLLQSSVSHDLSEIILIYWFAAQETVININSENSCTVITVSWFFDEKKVQKNSIYLKTDIFSNKSCLYCYFWSI